MQDAPQPLPVRADIEKRKFLNMDRNVLMNKDVQLKRNEK